MIWTVRRAASKSRIAGFRYRHDDFWENAPLLHGYLLLGGGNQSCEGACLHREMGQNVPQEN
ncbi:hypothetical protein PspLS_04870 [Pyricularia sp. CBS 133598]|nr:hypothetical protein PspLS_04870 [Pyricularia sp. CBS 133598]